MLTKLNKLRVVGYSIILYTCSSVIGIGLSYIGYHIHGMHAYHRHLDEKYNLVHPDDR